MFDVRYNIFRDFDIKMQHNHTVNSRQTLKFMTSENSVNSLFSSSPHKDSTTIFEYC